MRMEHCWDENFRAYAGREMAMDFADQYGWWATP